MKVVRSSLSFSLQSLEDFQDAGLAQSVISRILSIRHHELAPTRYGRSQPTTTPISMSDFKPVVREWLGESVSWPGPERDGALVLESDSKTSYQIAWHKRTRPMFSSVGGNFDLEPFVRDDSLIDILLSVVKDLCASTKPVYGEVRNWSFPGFKPLDLQRRLPNIPWLSIYGPPYISLFGRDRLLSAPFSRVVETDSGDVWAFACDSVHQEVSETVQSSIRAHLGEDAFMSGTRWRYSDGRAPIFDFSNVTLAQPA